MSASTRTAENDSDIDNDGTDDITQMAQGFMATVKDPILPEFAVEPGVQVGPHKPRGEAADLAGGGGYSGTDNPDQVGRLTLEQRNTLLRANRVEIQSDGTYRAAGYVMESGMGLNWASQAALVFKADAVRLEPYLGVRKDNGSSAYSEWESEWQQQTDAVAQAGGGMPLLFKVSSSYTHSSSSAGYSAGKNVYFQFSYRLTKARLIIDSDSFELTPGFDSALRKALRASDPVQRGEKLLEVFHTFGQFVGLDMTLGGRITLTKSEKVTDQSTAEKSFNSFRIAASASFTIEGAPIEGEAGTGTQLQSKSRLTEYLQQKSLEMEVVGGIDKAAMSDATKFGQAWLPSPDRFDRWQVIGFRPGCVAPMIEFLPDDIRQACVEAIKSYYRARLMSTQTEKLGKTTWTTDFADHIAFDKTIRQVRFRFDRVLDSLHTEWDQGGKTISQGQANSGNRWHGGAHDDKGNGDAGFDLDKGEDIAAVEVTLTGQEADATVRRIAFYTTFGRRFPQSAGTWYGGPPGNKDSGILRVSAPRVRGLCGTEGNYIDSIGLRYYAFRDGTVTPEFLESIERYLFPR